MLRELRIFIRLLPAIHELEALLHMKFQTGILVIAGVELIRGLNSVTPLIPDKMRYWVYIGTAVIGIVIQSLAHLSNPDGTAANLPQGLTPDQLEAYRKQFIAPKQ